MTSLDIVPIVDRFLECSFMICVAWFLKMITIELFKMRLLLKDLVDLNKDTFHVREKTYYVRDSANDLINRLIKEKDEINSKNS